MMSVQTRRAVASAFPCDICDPDFEPDHPTADLRRLFAECLQVLDRAIAAEQDLELAIGDDTSAMFNPAMINWLKAAETAWDCVTDHLSTLRKVADDLPDSLLSKMSFCLSDAMSSTDLREFDHQILFGRQLVAQALQGPAISVAARDTAQLLSFAVERLEIIANRPFMFSDQDRAEDMPQQDPPDMTRY
jgi:hypothetical protein